MATFYKGGTGAEIDAQMAPLNALITSGTYRDIPPNIIPQYFSGQLSLEDAMAKIQGTPIFNPTIGPQIDTGSGPKSIVGFKTNPGIGTGFSGTVDGKSVGTPIPNPIPAPSGQVLGAASATPTLPTPTAPTKLASFVTSSKTNLDTYKAAVDAENAKRQADYQTKIDALDKQQADLKILQENGIINQQSATQTAVNDKNAALTLEKQRFDENYNASQTLINEMDGLLTTGNDLIAAQKAETGLASIRNPRIDKTIADVTARAGVIKTLLDARSGQMGQAQAQLKSTTDAVSSVLKDQLDYYSTLQNFYKNQKDENGKVLVVLNADQKDYLDANLISLKADLARVEKNAQAISDAMVDPDTALLYAKAGISLTDTPTEMSVKLSTQIKWNLANGYTANGTAKAPVVAVDNSTMFTQAKQFITDNPNATADELTLGLRQNTKLSDGDIAALVKNARPETIESQATAAFKTSHELGLNEQQIKDAYKKDNGVDMPANLVKILDAEFGVTASTDSRTPWWKVLLGGINMGGYTPFK